MERYHVIGGHLRLDPEGTVTSYADAQRALDAAQEQILSLGIKLDTSNGIRNGMSETIATLQAQLPAEMPGCTILFKECEKGHGRLTATNWIDHGCGTCTLESLQAQLRQVEGERNTARHRVDELEAREIDVEILQGDLATLRQLVEVHTKQLTELTIIPIGCSREQELRWTQSIKDLRATLTAQDAGKVSTSIIGKQVPPSQWDKNAGVSGDVS